MPPDGRANVEILMPVKRGVGYNVKVRVTAGGAANDTAKVKMSMNAFDEIVEEEAVYPKEAARNQTRAMM
jgi:electron transfer flavoprotein alpha/beta subunit